MVLRRNSLISQGFIVHPGIIDEDFIKIMAYVKREMQINTGDGIADQLLFR